MLKSSSHLTLNMYWFGLFFFLDISPSLSMWLLHCDHNPHTAFPQNKIHKYIQSQSPSLTPSLSKHISKSVEGRSTWKARMKNWSPASRSHFNSTFKLKGLERIISCWEPALRHSRLLLLILGASLECVYHSYRDNFGTANWKNYGLKIKSLSLSPLSLTIIYIT